MTTGFVAPVHVRWSDIDMYQHINHATMVTILEEARIPFLREPFGADITTIGLLIHEVNILYKGQLRLMDSPVQVTMGPSRCAPSISRSATRCDRWAHRRTPSRR